MNSKLLLIGSLSVLAVIGLFFASVSIDKTTNATRSLDYSYHFSGGNMTFHKEWCSKTNGDWVDSFCHFENQEMFDKAKLVKEEARKSKITGITAKNVCDILEIPCPDEPVFEANFNPNGGISGFTYVKGDVQYVFNVRGDEIKYKIQEEDSEWMTFGDPTNHERFSRIIDTTVNLEQVDYDDFAFSLYHQITKDDKASNLFFSPFSISTAFSMAYEGARGNTAVQMMDAFDFPHDDKTRWDSISDAMKRLNHEKGFYALEVANGIWLSKLHETKPEYVDIVTTHYNGTAKSVDFVGNEGVDEINQWVQEKTRDKIQNILEPGSTDDLTLLVLTNSIYFNGKWSNQFSPDRTGEESFWTGDGKSVKAQMMKIPADMFNYAETGTVQILEMPYLGNDISMIVMLPKDKDELGSLEASLDSDKIHEFRDMLERQPLTVHIPKFGFESEYNLAPLLKELGVHDAFSDINADFAGMTDKQVYLSQAKHKAFVDVHEKGTEAAAVTVAIASLTSGPPDPQHEFIADHPFVFVIQEKQTGQILFIGRVMDPTQ